VQDDAGRSQVRRRSTRRVELALATLFGLFAGAAIALGVSALIHHHGGHGSGSSSSGYTPPRIAHVSPPRFRISRRSELAAEIRAVRRLARYGLPVYCGGARRRMVALTFDDGPGVYTHLAVRKLRAAGLHVTFFLVGKEILAWRGLAQTEKPIAVFGDHTMTHPFLPALDHAEMVQEVAEDQALIERTVHEPVLLFRPPYEGRSPAIDAESRRLGMAEILWNVDSADSLGANYLGIEHNVIAGLRPGSIILMHENRGQTIRALPVIFAALKRSRLRAVTVEQLLYYDPPTLRQLRRGYDGCAVAGRRGNGS
jgi:peptidoglycan/xylan/chitin deacetylase (PgdA/CDA1 family)